MFDQCSADIHEQQILLLLLRLFLKLARRSIYITIFCQALYLKLQKTSVIVVFGLNTPPPLVKPPHG